MPAKKPDRTQLWIAIVAAISSIASAYISTHQDKEDPKPIVKEITKQEIQQTQQVVKKSIHIKQEPDEGIQPQESPKLPIEEKITKVVSTPIFIWSSIGFGLVSIVIFSILIIRRIFKKGD